MRGKRARRRAWLSGVGNGALVLGTIALMALIAPWGDDDATAVSQPTTMSTAIVSPMTVLADDAAISTPATREPLAKPVTSSPPAVTTDKDGRDLSQIIIPPVRKTNPVVPPKPEALRAWLSKI